APEQILLDQVVRCGVLEQDAMSHRGPEGASCHPIVVAAGLLDRDAVSLAAVKCRGAADGAVLDLHMPCRPQDDRAFAERVYGQVEQVNPLRQRPTVAPDLHGEAGGLRTVAIQRQVAYGDVAAPAR